MFCDWFELYFKIAEYTIDENYLKLFSDALSLIKRTSEANDEDDNTEIKATQIEEANKVISELKDKLEQSKKREEVLQNELNNANERLRQIQAELNESNDKLQKAEASLSEIHDELNHYHMLERYADGENACSQFSLFQYTSIGQIKYDYNERRMIFRLADITSDGKIMPFIADENSSRYFANRDRLYWKNGPDTENAIGVWNWNAIPRDTDPEKDYLETDYCFGIQLTQIIEISKCESLDDIATFLIEGRIYMNKMFCFQCEQTAGCKGCTGASGVCGKKADTAAAQDDLTGKLIGLARATEGNEHLVTDTTYRLIIEGLFTTIH